jgi:hypothetical protein
MTTPETSISAIRDRMGTEPMSEAEIGTAIVPAE